MFDNQDSGKYNKGVSVIVKVAYSILSQAVKLLVEENGETSGWDTSVESEVMPKYILPYLTGATRLNIDFRKYTLKTLSSTPGAYGANIIYVLQNGMFFLIEI